jgi:hypothetical protein
VVADAGATVAGLAVGLGPCVLVGLGNGVIVGVAVGVFVGGTDVAVVVGVGVGGASVAVGVGDGTRVSVGTAEGITVAVDLSGVGVGATLGVADWQAPNTAASIRRIAKRVRLMGWFMIKPPLSSI